MGSKKLENSIIDEENTFASFNLDERLQRAILKMRWFHPTVIQSAAIPLALEGKDILARARTGSGKTAAYSIPIMQTLLSLEEELKNQKKGITTLVLVPTKELCEQVRDHFNALKRYCSDKIVVQALSGENEQKARLLERIDILISTPSRVLSHLVSKRIELKNSLKMLVIDEADLILSYGYEKDIKELISYLPKICQSFLMSATLNTDVDLLKRLVLHTPAIIKMEEDKNVAYSLTEYYIQCDNKERFLITYALIRLKVIPGKAIFFVNDIDDCYRLKLFLERFSINSAVLNSELPQKSRSHILQEFNQGIFNYLIASDETMLVSKKSSANEKDTEEEQQEGKEEEQEEKTSEIPEEEQDQTKKKNEHQVEMDHEYGIARGVDFQNVQTVINFDFPQTSKRYIHRVGRTARGGAKGTALSFITPKDEQVFEKVQKKREEQGTAVHPYQLNKKVLDSLRYRVEDMLRSVTKLAIREARISELKKEIKNSEKLKTHFEENPKDLALIQHSRPSQAHLQYPHLKALPDYLVPSTVQKDAEKQAQKEKRKRMDEEAQKKKRRKFEKDPLKTLSANYIIEGDSLGYISENRQRKLQKHGKKGKKKKTWI